MTAKPNTLVQDAVLAVLFPKNLNKKKFRAARRPRTEFNFDSLFPIDPTK